MVLQQFIYRVAFIATAVVHLHWNDLINAAIAVVRLCLANPGQPILLSILRLHALVLASFVLGFCFQSVSATQQTAIGANSQVLDFDEVHTAKGWADISRPYHNLAFEGFYIFEPSDPSFEGLISPYDLNCAASKPNALYGSRTTDDRSNLPTISTGHFSSTFELRSLRIKPLNMPLGFVTINLLGSQISQGALSDPLTWTVDFPVGFHEPLLVKLKEFTGVSWGNLTKLQIWADFHKEDEDFSMDWEFCVDDLEVDIKI